MNSFISYIKIKTLQYSISLNQVNMNLETLIFLKIKLLLLLVLSKVHNIFAFKYET